MEAVRRSRPVAEPEVVLAYLRGELDSERFAEAVRDALMDVGGLDLVRRPDLNAEEKNRARADALTAARGWRSNSGLFSGFPDDVSWSHGTLELDQLLRLRFINYSYWVELSGGSRRPADVAETLRAGALPAWMKELGTNWCFDLARRLATADAVGDLIIMATPNLDELVVLEGHARLTGIFVGKLEWRLSVTAYVGVSAAISQWELF
jgi:hypothetical protein